MFLDDVAQLVGDILYATYDCIDVCVVMVVDSSLCIPFIERLIDFHNLLES